ncbi:aminotransferase class III-fold pyridoxal phosphate-dependent enzyme, partial [Staphylococcus epidermidis]|uniref:aminotransferase class III-fold pyridoxal phosphate-dependent enzyme n=1 Tax=Staphylococcus epidermidis TaxID=1282 RepID=UPI0028CB4FEA
MIEIIQGQSQLLPPHPLFINQLNHYSKQKHILIILHHLQTPIPTTPNLYPHQHYQFSPHIITLPKPLPNALPIPTILAKNNLPHPFPYPSHPTTFPPNTLSFVPPNQTLSIINHA